MRLWPWLAAVLAALMFLVPAASRAQGEGNVILLTAEGPVTPAMGGYLERGLREAEGSRAELLILRLDTPGGSVEVMGQLVRQLSNTSIPTLVYVWPSGGRAASAGTFVTLSADLAAMAPQTTIGAASVVSGDGESMDETLQAKITNDLVAAIRSQTSHRGPEAAEWAERAITEAIAANDGEALEIGIIDFVARDLDDLLDQAHGRTVELANGEQRQLNLQNATVREIAMNPLESLLHIITDPNIALLLISLGSIALFYELTSPGGYVGGIFGIIATLLGFYALGSLDANWTGLGLMAFAVVLFILEIKAATHGLFAFGGVAAFLFGSIILFQTSYAPVSLSLIAVMALVLSIFFIIAVTATIRSRSRPAITGREGLMGSIGEVRTALNPEGYVFVEGELWQARSRVPLAPGSTVRVVAMRGLHLEVEPASEEWAAIAR